MGLGFWLGTTALRADEYFTTNAHGFAPANCTGGIAAIYVVNSQWICVLNDGMSNLWDEIVSLDKAAYGGGLTNRYQICWSNYLAGGTDYDYWRDLEQMYDRWAPQIRPAQETPLNTASFYKVTSPDDARYLLPQEATEVGRYINSIKQWIDPQSGWAIPNQLHNVNYSWIRLPLPLSNGCRYAVTQDNGKTGNFLYDEDRTISYAIHGNQIGYLHWAPEKYAYVGAWGGSYGPIAMPELTNRSFTVVDRTTGAGVFTNAVALRYDPRLHMPRVQVNGMPATQATSYWHYAHTFTVEDQPTVLTVVVYTAAGATNAVAHLTYTWKSDATDVAVQDGDYYPQSGYTSQTATLELRIFPMVEPIGEYVYELDFSACTNVGAYYLRVSGVGRSWPFRIGPDVYGEAFYKTMKGLYQQRSGFEVKSNRLAWARPAAHMHNYRSSCASVDSWWPNAQRVNGAGEIGFFEQASAEIWNMRRLCGAESNYARFASNPRALPEWASALDRDYLIPNCYGGWYDAADYDKRPYHFNSVFDLVATYLIASNAMSDGQCNMDESGNGIPDILDECIWAMRIYRTSQREDGGVSIRFESAGHPGSAHGTNNTVPYFASYPDRFSAVMYAGTAALLSWVVRPYNVEIADDYLHSASNAYAFSQNPDHRVRTISYWVPSIVYSGAISDLFTNHEGTLLEYRASSNANEHQVWVDDIRSKKWNMRADVYRLVEYRYDEPTNFFPQTDYQDCSWNWYAPFYLYLASGHGAYADIVNELKDAYSHFRTDNDRSANFIMALVNSAAIRESIRNACRQSLLDEADAFVEAMTNRAYRQTDLTPGGWGESTLQHDSRRLIEAYVLTGHEDYRNKAILVNDFMLGARPCGLNFTTGMGWYYIVNFLHHTSQDDGFEDPSPGITTYAPNGSTASSWLNRGYRLSFNRTFDRLGYTGVTNVQAYLLPPPFDEAGGEARNDIPNWRKFHVYEGHAGIWEFTINETVSPTVLGYGAFVPPGWMPGEGLTNLAPRPAHELFGKFFMP